MAEKKGEEPIKEETIIKDFKDIPLSYIKALPTAAETEAVEKLVAAAMGGKDREEFFPAPDKKTPEAPVGGSNKGIKPPVSDLKSLKFELEKAENPPAVFEKIATPEQKKARTEEIERLKKEINSLTAKKARIEKEKVIKTAEINAEKIEAVGGKPEDKTKGIEAGKVLVAKIDTASKKMETRIKTELSEADKEILQNKIINYKNSLKEARQKGDKEDVARLERMIKDTEVNLYETVEAKPASAHGYGEAKSSAEKKHGGKPEVKSAQLESLMQRKTREYQEKHHQAMEIEIANLDQRDVELWSYRLANKKFDIASGDIPIHFKATPEIEKAVKNFLANRSMLTKAEQAHKKSGKKGGEEEMWLKNHELSTNRSLDVLKLSMFNDMVADKAGFLKSQGLSDKKVQEMMEKEELPYFHNTIASFARCAEGDLMKTRMDALVEPRERGMISRAMEKYNAMPKWKRLIVGGAVAGGIGAGIGLWGGAGLAVAAYIGGTRAARALFGGSVAAGINTIADFFIGRKYGKQKATARATQDKASLQRMQAEVANMKKEGKNWMEHEEGKLRLMEMLDEDMRDGNKELQKITARERRTRGIAIVASGLAGGLAAWATSANWDSIIGGKSAVAASVAGYESGINIEKSACFEMGNRGPEGSIIDHFKSHPDMAKSFGWDGKTDFNIWAGSKAHLLWLENAKNALKNPETLEQLHKLGYSADAEGYANMMHRIGKGTVQLDIGTGKMSLENMEYLKIGSEGALADTGENAGYLAEKIIPTEIEGLAGEIAFTEKVGGVMSRLYPSEQAGLVREIKQMGGWNKFLDSPASSLFYQEGAELDIFRVKFGLQLKQLTNDSYMLYDNKTPIRKIIGSL